MQDLSGVERTPPSIGIVGGGMVGATLALLLARNLPGAKVTLFDCDKVDSEERPSFDRRSTAIAPSTVQCFQRLGLWSALATHATPIQHIHVSDKGHAGMALFDPSDNGGEPLGYVVDNAGMGRVLLEAIDRQPLVRSIQARVKSIAMNASGAMLQWTDGAEPTRENFNLVVVADGAESALRKQLGIGVRRVDYQQYAIVANVRHELPHQLQAFERFTQRGPIALLPRGGHARSCESALVWTCPASEIDDYQSCDEEALVKRLQSQFGFRLGRLMAMSAPSFYPLALLVAQEQVRSNVVLMGNAAHFLHPVAGQGFNLSVRDTLRLVATLKGGVTRGQCVGDLAVLQDYEKQQVADQRNTIGLSHGFNRIFTRTPLPVQLLRTSGLIALELNPMLRAQFIRLLSGRAQPAAQVV